MTSLVLVTGNQGKLREVQQFFSNTNSNDGAASPVEISSVKLDLPEWQASSAAEVSRRKAVEAYTALHHGSHERGGAAVLVDDTSLEFVAMKGMPGPYIKWFLEAMGVEGLIRMLDGFATPQDDGMAHRRANAVCIFSCCAGGDGGDASSVPVEQFVGVCPGTIATAPRGASGFGWDSIFIPDEQPDPAHPRTFAEMSIAEKNGLSHRTKALQKLRHHFCTKD